MRKIRKRFISILNILKLYFVNELNKYYWSSCGYEQHFKEEEWMDEAPVIICSGYLNEKGFNFNKNFKKKIEYLRKKFSKK
jgi:hypothetical protein